LLIIRLAFIFGRFAHHFIFGRLAQHLIFGRLAHRFIFGSSYPAGFLLIFGRMFSQAGYLLPTVPFLTKLPDNGGDMERI